MSEKVQVTFRIESHYIESIDNFIKNAGLSRSKFVEHITKSAADSIKKINTVTTEYEYNKQVDDEISAKIRGEADMKSAREIIEAIFKLNQAIGDGDEN